jgi:TRAP-type mannitol/chloroaromatic compound transport system substrate-binding protein
VSEVAGGLPFGFTNLFQSQFLMFEGGLLEILRESYAKQNVYPFPGVTYPIALMTKKPINGIEDLQGVKLRAFGTMALWLQKLGAVTTYLSGAELYTALSTGVVEGAHWGAAGPSYKMKLHEVLKNYMLPEPIIGAWNTMFINMNVWKKMTPRQRAIFEAASKAYRSYDVTLFDQMGNNRALDEMTEKWGVKVNQLPAADIEKMKRAAREVWDEVAAKDPLNKKAVDLLKNFREDKTVWLKRKK